MTRLLSVTPLGLALFCLTATVDAQPADPPQGSHRADPGPGDTIRKITRGGPDIADEAAFMVALEVVQTLNESDSNTAVAIVQQETGLSPLGAETLLAAMLEARETFRADVRAKKLQVCKAGVSRGKRPAFNALEAMDRVDDHVAAHAFHRFRAEIGPDNATRLDEWLQRMKSDVTHYEVDYDALFKKQGERAVKRLQEICTRLYSTQAEGH